MPSSSRLLEFALLSWALIAVPGPNVLFVISRSLQLGRAAGLAAVAGGALGVYFAGHRRGHRHRGTGRAVPAYF
jgi:threonine/homoserine/homoserine lactone efflux protein